MNVLKNNILFFLGLNFFLSLILFSLDLKWDLVGLSFYILILSTTIYMVFSLKKQISSILFVYIFFITFFSIFPWVQYTNNVLIWSNNLFSNYDYLKTNIILFFSLLIIFFSYKGIKYNLKNLMMKENPRLWLGIFVNVICLFVVIYYNNFNITSMIFRGGVYGDDVLEKLNSPLFTLILYFSRFFPGFLFLKYITSNNPNKSNLVKIVLFLFVLGCAFPLGIPRFMVAFIYFPIIYYFLVDFRKTYVTFSFLILSLVFIFPFLDQFRVFDISRDIQFIPEKKYFLQAHFDAYQNFMEAIRTNYITYGWQLLGVSLFFIPRFIWDNKPVGSGYQMANDLNYHFSNISMPFLGEGFVNFGLIGVCLFSIILGAVCKTIDHNLLSLSNSKINRFQYFFGIFCCASIFFIMRGDLMSSFSYTIAGIVAYKIVKKI